MQDLLRRPLVPLEMTEENKKVALVNELLMDKNNFVYIKRADGTFPSIQDIIIEYLGGSMVFRGFVDTRADLDKIDLDKRAIGDMWIVRKDETYKDPEDNTNIEYIVMEDTREDGTKYRYWECLGNPFARGIDESYPIYGSTKLITSTAVFEYTNNNFISAIKWNDDEDTITYTVGYQSSEDGKIKTKEITIGGSTHRKVESRPDQSKIKYITGTPTNDTNNDVLLFDSGVYIGKTPGELNSKSFNTKAILVTDANDSANSRTVINGTSLSTAAGVSVTHEKADFKVGNLGEGLYDLIINDKVLTSNSETINLVGFNSFNAIGGENSTMNLSSNIINIAHTSGKGLINMGFSTLRMNNNLYFEGSNKIYNLGSPIEINYDLTDDQKQPVYLGTSNTTSIGRGSWIFGNKNDYNAKIDINGVLDLSAGTDDKTSNIYDVFKANNKTGVSLYSKSSGTPILLAQFTRSESDFYQNVNIADSKVIKLHKEGVTDAGTDTILSPGNLKLVDTTSTDNYTEYRYNKILSKIAFNIEAAAINIGNSVGTPISIGYKDSTGSIKSGSSWEEISLNGRVVLPKTETVLSEKADFGDIDDLYKFLSQLKKGLSEGLQSINSALALMGGGLDEVTDTTNFSEIVTAIKDFRAMTTEDSGDSGILYSTINGSSYRRSVNTIYGKDDGTIRAEIKQFSGKKDTTYTVTDKTLLTTSWTDNVLNWTSSKISRTGELASIPKWSTDDLTYVITPNTTGGTSGRKNIVTAGRWWFKNNVVVKPVDETVDTYYTKKDTVDAAPVEGSYLYWSSEATDSSVPYIGIAIKEGYYNSSLYKLTNPIIRFNAKNIDITKKPLIYGSVKAQDVLKGKTFSSASTGYNTSGTMDSYEGNSSNPVDLSSATTSMGVSTGSGNEAKLMLVLKRGCYGYRNTQTDAVGNQTYYVDFDDLPGYPADSFGNAAIENVLTGKTFTSNVGRRKTGTMPNNGAVSKSLDCGDSYTIAKGYHDGNGKITANSLSSQTDATAVASDILKGKTAWVKGSKITGSMPNNSVGGIQNVSDEAIGQGWTKVSNKNVYSMTFPKGYYCDYLNADNFMAFSFYLDMSTVADHGLPSDIFGDLTAADAPSDKTFTSSSGLKISGSVARRGAHTTIGDSYHVWSNGSLYMNMPEGLYNTLSTAGYVEGVISVNNIPFNETSLFGDAEAVHVLKGATFTSGKAGRLSTGTMPSNGSVSKSLNCGESFTIPAGHHDGTGKVTANSLSSQTSATAAAENIESGKTAWVNGSKVTGSLILDYAMNSYCQAEYYSDMVFKNRTTDVNGMGDYLKNNNINAGCARYTLANDDILLGSNKYCSYYMVRSNDANNEAGVGICFKNIACKSYTNSTKFIRFTGRLIKKSGWAGNIYFGVGANIFGGRYQIRTSHNSDNPTSSIGKAWFAGYNIDTVFNIMVPLSTTGKGEYTFPDGKVFGTNADNTTVYPWIAICTTSTSEAADPGCEIDIYSISVVN